MFIYPPFCCPVISGLATFMPLLMSCSMTDAESVAGPMVHAILVRLFKNLGCFIVTVLLFP
jgi:hypothetical protein